MNAKRTKLQAVNEMLEAVSLQPINSLEGEKSIDTAIAIDTIDSTTREVQGRSWEFNTIRRTTLKRNTENHVVIPHNIVSVTASEDDETFVRRYQDQKDKLYDKVNESFEFTKDPVVDIVYLFDFEELPPNCQSYVTMRAVRSFQNKVEGDDTLYRYTKEDEISAFITFKLTEGEIQNYNMLTDNEEIIDFLIR